MIGEFELIKKQEIEGREAPLCLEPQTSLRSCAQGKLDHQGAWIVLDVFQILTSVLSIPFLVSFQSFLALPWRQWGTVLSWHSLLGVRGVGRRAAKKESWFSACSQTGIATPSPRWKNDTGG